MDKEKTTLLGIIITWVSWIAAWIILYIKLDVVTYIGFILFALGLSGLIIWVLVPIVIELRLKEYSQLPTKGREE